MVIRLNVLFQEPRSTVQSRPNVHPKETDDHDKATPLGEDLYFYESDDDDSVAEGMYIDDEVDVEGNVEKEICPSEDATITERSGKDSQVIDASNDVQKGAKRGRKPSTRAVTMTAAQPPTKRTRRAA